MTDDEIIASLSEQGMGEIVTARLFTLVAHARHSLVKDAVRLAYLEGKDNSFPLSKTWEWVLELRAAREKLTPVAEGGSVRGSLPPREAKSIYYLSLLTPAALLGHVFRLWKGGNHEAAVRLLAYADDLVFAMEFPTAADRLETFKAKLRARIAHAENAAMREEAIAYYLEHRERFDRPSKDGKRGKDVAAQEISEKVVPVKPRTVRDWLKGV